MANVGMRSVTLLKDYPAAGLKEGDVVEANVWLNLDAYVPCAEVAGPNGHAVGLGRMEWGGWKYTEEPSRCMHGRTFEDVCERCHSE